MTQADYALGVEQWRPGSFVWVLMECVDADTRIELVSSVETFRSASEALTAGKKTLERLGQAASDKKKDA
jgi:hypothetical protein